MPSARESLGQAASCHRISNVLSPGFPSIPGARAIITVAIERVQTSCGYSIPFLDYQDERPTLQQWAARKGEDGLREYWAEKNVESIDGLPALDHP